MPAVDHPGLGVVVVVRRLLVVRRRRIVVFRGRPSYRCCDCFSYRTCCGGSSSRHRSHGRSPRRSVLWDDELAAVAIALLVGGRVDLVDLDLHPLGDFRSSSRSGNRPAGRAAVPASASPGGPGRGWSTAPAVRPDAASPSPAPLACGTDGASVSLGLALAGRIRLIVEGDSAGESRADGLAEMLAIQRGIPHRSPLLRRCEIRDLAGSFSGMMST